ncbi:MAG: hypothetical protein AB7F40_00940 [Victivallaceae bacterium]|nr:hypothetical protein [Victivallaceae bacterium]
MRNQLLATVFLLAACGCECLPEGDPPKGQIVQAGDTTAKPLSEEAAINFMTTEFGMTAVASVEPGSRVEITGNAPRQAFEVMRRSAAFIRLVPSLEPEEWVLKSDIDGGVWSLELANSGKQVFFVNTKLQTP